MKSTSTKSPSGVSQRSRRSAILGAEWERFEESSEQIREEFRHVSYEDYRAGRIKVLESFLQRPQLYLTEHFSTRYEAQARENLRRWFEELRQ
jgi:predicted metal-dependent HD superfamily phosphohydrolase